MIDAACRPCAMDHDEVATLLGAYALDALDELEHKRVERHLKRCPRCQAEITRHQYVVALLGVPQPPDD